MLSGGGESLRKSLSPLVAVFLLNAGGAVAGGALQFFDTPSGNISCLYFGSENGASGSAVVCNIRQFAPSFNASYAASAIDPIANNLDLGCVPDQLSRYGIQPNSSVGYNFCPLTDLLSPGIASGSNVKVLALQYGTVFERDGILCQSSKQGLTCKNATGHGFFLSRASQSVF